MPRVTLLAVCLAVAVLVACGGGDPRPTPSQTEGTTQALPSPTTDPTGTRTGIPEIDAVLDTVFSGDEEAVGALIG